MDNQKDENKQEPKKQAEETTQSGGDTLIPNEILDAMPEEDRVRVEGYIRQFMMFSNISRRSNPIAEKITEEHITKIIDKSENQDIRDKRDRNIDRLKELIILVIGLIFLTFLIIFLKDNEEMLYKIILAIISFVGGFGFGKTKSRKED